MSGFELDWRGHHVLNEIEARSINNLTLAILYLHGRLRQVLNRGGAGGKHRSSPGEPPRKQIGHLQDGVVWEIDKNAKVGRIGLRESAEYGIWLELGTSRIEPRPWIRVVWEQHKKRAIAIAGGKN